MWKGELVSESCGEELVCLKYSEGLVIVIVGARLPVLKGEPVRLSDRARFHKQ